MTNGQFDTLDFLAAAGFIIGLLNYTENVDQTQMQDSVNDAVLQIHKHLIDQDNKLDKIMGVLKIDSE